MRRGAQRDIPFEYRYDEGTLSLEIHETETGALLWRAWAEAEIKPEATPAERRKRAGEAVGLLLERLDSR